MSCEARICPDRAVVNLSSNLKRCFRLDPEADHLVAMLFFLFPAEQLQHYVDTMDMSEMLDQAVAPSPFEWPAFATV